MLPLGKKIEDVNIQFRLTTLNTLHAKWLLEFYNYITSDAGAEIILNGWKGAGIYDALKMSAAALPSLHPFRIFHSCQEMMMMTHVKSLT